MISISELLSRVTASGHEVWYDGPQPISAITQLESKFNLQFPRSYRAFLIEFGSMAICDSTISGIIDGEPWGDGRGWLYYDTLLYRNEWDLPQELLIIQPDEEAPYCLDISNPSVSGEFPIVCYELHAKCVRQIAADFEDWMRRCYLQGWL